MHYTENEEVDLMLIGSVCQLIKGSHPLMKKNANELIRVKSTIRSLTTDYVRVPLSINISFLVTASSETNTKERGNATLNQKVLAHKVRLTSSLSQCKVNSQYTPHHHSHSH